MSFWSDIEPYVQYWLRADISRYDNPDDASRIGSRRTKRYIGDDRPPETEPETLERTRDAYGYRSRRGRHARVARTDDEYRGNQAALESATTKESTPNGLPIPVARKPVLTSTADNQEEIEELKTRYIVGRRAGKDILSRDGQAIIHKGEVIDRQVVTECEAAGKLVELILHMVIEDFDI